MPKKQPMNIYQKITSKYGLRLNDKIMEGFLSHYQRDDIHKTHLFGGRRGVPIPGF